MNSKQAKERRKQMKIQGRARRALKNLLKNPDATSLTKAYWKKTLSTMLKTFPTSAELELLPYMAEMHFEFQQPMFGFIPDFVHSNKKIAVEVDGSVHGTSEVKDRDRTKDLAFANRGWRVIRFTNSEVLGDVQAVVKKISAAIEK